MSSRGEWPHGARQRLLDLPQTRPTPGPAAPEAPHRRSAGCSAPRDRPRPRVSTTRRTATAAAPPCPKRPEQAPPHDQNLRSSLHDLTSAAAGRGTVARGPVTGRGRTLRWRRAERGQRLRVPQARAGRYHLVASRRRQGRGSPFDWNGDDDSVGGSLARPWDAGRGGTAGPSLPPCSAPAPAALRVFGGVACGEAGPDSDVDLLVDLADGTGLFALRRSKVISSGSCTQTLTSHRRTASTARAGPRRRRSDFPLRRSRASPLTCRR